MERELDTCIRIAGGLVGRPSVLRCSFGAFPFMEAGCKMLLNQSGMTHISLVLMFTYVNDNNTLRTDGPGSLLLSDNVHFSFSGQDSCSALLCTAVRDMLVQWAIEEMYRKYESTQISPGWKPVFSIHGEMENSLKQNQQVGDNFHCQGQLLERDTATLSKPGPLNSWQYVHNSSQIMNKMNALVSNPDEKGHWPRWITSSPWYPHICFHLQVVPHYLHCSRSHGLFWEAWIACHFSNVENSTFIFCYHLCPVLKKVPPHMMHSFQQRGLCGCLLASPVISLVFCFPTFLACSQTELLLLFLKRANDLP